MGVSGELDDGREPPQKFDGGRFGLLDIKAEQLVNGGLSQSAGGSKTKQDLAEEGAPGDNDVDDNAAADDGDDDGEGELLQGTVDTEPPPVSGGGGGGKKRGGGGRKHERGLSQSSAVVAAMQNVKDGAARQGEKKRMPAEQPSMGVSGELDDGREPPQKFDGGRFGLLDIKAEQLVNGGLSQSAGGSKTKQDLAEEGAAGDDDIDDDDDDEYDDDDDDDAAAGDGEGELLQGTVDTEPPPVSGGGGGKGRGKGGGGGRRHLSLSQSTVGSKAKQDPTESDSGAASEDIVGDGQ